MKYIEIQIETYLFKFPHVGQRVPWTGTNTLQLLKLLQMDEHVLSQVSVSSLLTRGPVLTLSCTVQYWAELNCTVLHCIIP